MPKTGSDKAHLQAANGAQKTKKSGSHLDQGPHGAGKKGKSISQKGGNIPGNVPKARNISGSHLDPHPALTDKTAVRGGGTVKGHDRVNPNAGKSKSGSKFDQHPSLKKR